MFNLISEYVIKKSIFRIYKGFIFFLLVDVAHDIRHPQSFCTLKRKIISKAVSFFFCPVRIGTNQGIYTKEIYRSIDPFGLRSNVSTLKNLLNYCRSMEKSYNFSSLPHTMLFLIGSNLSLLPFRITQ